MARLMVGSPPLSASLGAAAAEGNSSPITGAFSSYQMPFNSIEDMFPRLSQTSIVRSARSPPALPYFPGKTEHGSGVPAGWRHTFIGCACVIDSDAANTVGAVSMGDPDRVRNFAEFKLERFQPAVGLNILPPRRAGVYNPKASA